MGKTLTIIKVVFLIIGVGLLSGAFYWYKINSQFIQEATETTGVVVDLVRSRSNKSTTYSPTIRFQTAKEESIEFTSNYSSNPPSYSKGDSVSVIYLASSPEHAKINSFFSLWFGPILLGGMGIIFSSIGGGIFLSIQLKQKKEIYLKQNGIEIETNFQSVEHNTNIRVNGRHPFRVFTQWQNPETTKVHVFKSNNLWFDPTQFIEKDKKIGVFIEKNNPKKYYVDLSFLPKLEE